MSLYDRTVYLDITSWIGISLDAKHFYGDLLADHRRVALLRPMTAKEAAHLNAREGMDGFYEAGHATMGFDTKDDVIAKAVSDYKIHFPNATVLLLGSPSYRDPKKCLDAPEHIRKVIDPLYSAFEKLGGYDIDENVDVAGLISDAFHAVFKYSV